MIKKEKQNSLGIEGNFLKMMKSISENYSATSHMVAHGGTWWHMGWGHARYTSILSAVSSPGCPTSAPPPYWWTWGKQCKMASVMSAPWARGRPRWSARFLALALDGPQLYCSAGRYPSQTLLFRSKQNKNPQSPKHTHTPQLTIYSLRPIERCVFPPQLFNIILEVLVRAIIWKWIESIQIEKKE